MKTPPRSRLLLMELVCDLVIFSLCAVVCVTLLVRSRAMSAESERLTRAVYLAQTAAEELLATGAPGASFGERDGLTVAWTGDGDDAEISVSDREGRVLFALPMPAWRGGEG